MSPTEAVVYPGSFDPVTEGHMDIIARARGIFPRVIVLVAFNASKTAFLTPEKRVELIRESVAERGWDNVDVDSHDGLVVDYLKPRGVRVLLRGLRAGGDFEHEFSISLMNRRLWSEVETVYLPTREDVMGISSSLVREVARLDGDLDQFVPAPVAKALRVHFERTNHG
ncbi:MAG: pantetheine-phosphate adenylyltransferase [Fibrobacterota bacterium]|jgi:pantetheine-phosphate adenylyltransferase